jgi:hypothetical protein
MEKYNKNWLYEFEIKNDKDETKKFAILKPNRKLKEEGELFYSSEVSRFAKAGVLPKAAWNTILSNGGGSISEKDREVYGNLLIDFRDKSFELQSILIKNVSDRTEDEKERAGILINDLENIKNEIQAFEASQISIFENTAESKARNRSILWWVLNLSYEIIEEQPKMIFEEPNFDSKLDSYDLLEDGADKNTFILTVLRRLTYLITLWFLGRANSFEDLKSYDDSLNQVEEVNESEVISTEETEPAPAPAPAPESTSDVISDSLATPPAPQSVG